MRINTFNQEFAVLPTDGLAREMQDLLETLFPFCRSITGAGVRKTLHEIDRMIPLEWNKVPSGTPVFDWTVPNEWNIRDAYIKDSSGNRVVDFQESNLHVVGYSIPVRPQIIPMNELRQHLHTLPDHPSWIPYRTSYYKENWGFCLKHETLLGMSEPEYEVCIDSTLKQGFLDYGEVLIEGDSSEEFLISTHICHPSLCNDNLSSIVVATFLARHLQTLDLRYSYRFLFLPGTIGSITWLALNEDWVGLIKHGLVLACLGDGGPPTYKKSRAGDSPVDRAASQALRQWGAKARTIDFAPYGYDERQYCSPGFNLPIGCLMRTPYGCFEEYHTSADNLEFVKTENLFDSLNLCLSIIDLLESDVTLRNTAPRCEPQLGKYGLYGSMGGGSDRHREVSLLWLLNSSDGEQSLMQIAAKSGIKLAELKEAARILINAGLLEPQEERLAEVCKG